MCVCLSVCCTLKRIMLFEYHVCVCALSRAFETMSCPTFINCVYISHFDNILWYIFHFAPHKNRWRKRTQFAWYLFPVAHMRRINTQLRNYGTRFLIHILFPWIVACLLSYKCLHFLYPTSSVCRQCDAVRAASSSSCIFRNERHVRMRRGQKWTEYAVGMI